MSKYDSFGRPVLAADWNALQDIPDTVAALGNSTPAGAGANVWTDNGEGAWAPISGGAPPVGGQVTGYMAADVTVSTGFSALISGVPVTPGATYAALFEDEWVTSGVGNFSTTIVPQPAGTVSPIGGGLALCANDGGGLVGNNRNIAAGSSNSQIYETQTNQVRLSGVFSVSDETTSVDFSVEVNAGSMTAKAGGYIILTRLQ